MLFALIISSHVTPLVRRIIERLGETSVRPIVLDAAGSANTHFGLFLSADGQMCVGTSYIKIDDETIPADDIIGVFLPTPSSFASAEGLNDRDSRFVYSEYSALVRYLSHAFGCRLVNRLRPEFWAEPVLGPQALHAFVSPKQRDRLPIIDMCFVAGDALGTASLDGGRDAAIWPLSQSDRYLPIDSVRQSGIGEAAKLIPLRFVEHGTAEVVDISVVGQTAHLPTAAPRTSDRQFIEQASIDVCEDLGVTFGQVRWVLTTDGPYLGELRTWPSIDQGDAALVDAVASATVRELVQ